MRVYHFLSEHWATESLVRKRLKVSLFSDMNDPFELLGVSLKRKADRNDFSQLKKEVSEEMGAICFSRRWRNPVLWSHYADKHNGIALGFDIPYDHAKPVSYTGERLTDEVIDSLHKDDGEDLALKLLTTKFKHWGYEEEVRILLRLKDIHKEANLYFLPYCRALQLREVIIGPRCGASIKNIRRVVPSPKNSVKIIKARLAFQTFDVVRDMRFK